MTFPAPFKVCIPSRGRARIGVAAYSYEHLREVLRKKYDVCGDFCLQQDDGTLVCDEDYFKLLEPNTSLTVVESEHTAAIMRHLTSGEGMSPGIKRPMQAQPDIASAVQQKRLHLEAPQPHSLHHVPRRTPPQPSRQGQCITSPIPGIIPLPRTDALYVPSGSHQPSSGGGSSSASLASQLQITNVVGNVSMTPSPPREVQRAPPPTLLNAVSHQNMPKLTPMNVMYRVPGPHLPAPLRCHPQTVSVGVPQYRCALPPAHPYMHGPSPHYPPSNHHLYPSALNSPPYLSGPGHPSHISLTRVPNHAPHFQTTHLSPAHNFPSVTAAPSTTFLSALQPSHPSAPPCPIATSLSHLPIPPVPHPPQTSLTPPPNLLSHPPVPLAPIPSPTSLPPGPNPPIAPSTKSLPPPPHPPPHPPSSQQDQTKTHSSLLEEGLTVLAKTLPEFLQVPTSTSAPLTSEPSPVGNTSSNITTQPPVSNPTSPVEPSPLPSPNFTLNLPPSPTDPEPPKLSTVEVVSCPNDAASLPDSDEDEDKLCIIEQVSTPTETPSHQKSLAKKRQKPSALPITAPSTQSLGDAKYPIIIDEDDTATKVIDLNFSDEGYSSSSSPYDTLCDFTTALPFAGYETENKTSRGMVDTFTNKDQEVVKEAETDTIFEEDPNSQTDTFQATDCVSEDVDEEDFDMDVDVFSPLPSPTLPRVAQTRPRQWQPPLPDYLPLEVDSERDTPCDENPTTGTSYSSYSKESSEESSDEKMLVVSIPRGSLTDPLYRKQHCHSLTDNLYVPPPHVSPRPRRREYIRRLSRCSVSSDSRQKVVRKHKKRKQKRRRNSAPVNSYRFPSCTRPEHLMVHIPIHRGKDGDILCGEYSDDSDVPTTAMELLAARLDETKGPKRLPQIIHLESSFPREESEDVHCKGVAESVVEVADYCSEMNIMSVCSAEDLTECVRDLTSLWSDREGFAGTPLDVGDEIELSGPLQNCAEVTGMELLNLQRTVPSSVDTKPLELPEATWSVHSLDSRGYLSDPRQRVQKYYLGDRAVFVLSCTNGRWQLHEP